MKEAKKTAPQAEPVPHHAHSDKAKAKSGNTPLPTTHTPAHAGSIQASHNTPSAPSAPLPATHAQSQASMPPTSSLDRTAALSTTGAKEKPQQQASTANQATAADGKEMQQEPVGKAAHASVAGVASIMSTYTATGLSKVGTQPSDVQAKTVCASSLIRCVLCVVFLGG